MSYLEVSFNCIYAAKYECNHGTKNKLNTQPVANWPFNWAMAIEGVASSEGKSTCMTWLAESINLRIKMSLTKSFQANILKRYKSFQF